MMISSRSFFCRSSEPLAFAFILEPFQPLKFNIFISMNSNNKIQTSNVYANTNLAPNYTDALVI